MDQASIRRLHEEASLWVWADRCAEAGEEQLPRLILDCCQVGYDLAYGEDQPVERKRAVLDLVNDGRLADAVSAMMAADCELELIEQGHGTWAKLGQPALGLQATASARHPLGAQLRGLMELVLTAEPYLRPRLLA